MCVSPSLKREYTGHFLTRLFTILTVFSAKPVSPEERLISDLLQNYTKEARPVRDPNNPIVVVFGFELVQLVNVVRKHITLHIHKGRMPLSEFSSRQYYFCSLLKVEAKLVNKVEVEDKDEFKVVDEVKSKSKSEPKSNSKSETKSKSKTMTSNSKKSKLKARSKSKAELKTKTKAKSKSKNEAKTRSMSKTKPNSKLTSGFKSKS